MPLTYLPILMFNALLGVLEASMSPHDLRMPERKVRKQTVIILE